MMLEFLANTHLQDFTNAKPQNRSVIND